MTAQDDPALSILGFDSAWVDNPRAPGALCAIRVDTRGRRRLVPPAPASFEGALASIAAETAPLRIVAIDQPTIVPNATGTRPADRAAASLISWLGGGVQPANRGKAAMFGDGAPIWRFRDALGAVEDPEASRSAASGLYLMEVFPALALPSLDPAFCGRRLGPRYNPARRKTFAMAGWRAVAGAVARIGREEAVEGLPEWAEALAALPVPRKPDQDRLDAVLCALVGLRWRTGPREASLMLGDLASGYMVAPASEVARARLEAAARRLGVPLA